MEILSNNIAYNLNNPVQKKNEQGIRVCNPSFQGKTGSNISSSLLSKAGSIMKWIEDGGFMVMFLIQDFLGMTVPRSIAGFMRDKEETGHYNKQEGFEVMGREGMTGPMMMAVAPTALWIASKSGRTTCVNSELIKHFGNNLTEFVSSSKFDKNLLKNADEFKKVFYEHNIQNILNETVGKENYSKESVDFIMTQLRNRENIPPGTKLKKFRGKTKYKDECMEKITQHINDLKYKSSSDLDLLEKVKLSNKQVSSTKDAFEALEKYTADAITFNKKLSSLDRISAERLKHSALGKRVITTVATIAATLGILSILPKIYARSNTAPGARKNSEISEDNKNNNITFKGKGNNIIESIGKEVDKNKSKFVSSELEYNGHNFTNTLMAGLSLFGLLTPRGLRAYNRAQTDENGKKDLTELWEILIRDVTSSLGVIFIVPMATRACVTSYEKNSGFVLMQKDRNMNNKKTLLDLLNPYSKSHVLTNSELSALYDNINSKEKMLNFCKYIDKNDGDLQKILSKSDELNTVFNKSTLDFSTLAGKSKADKNKQIISFFENIDKHAEKLGNKKADKKFADELITKLMKGASSGCKSKITSVARGLNSVPGILTTILISPYILGWVIPRFTYKNTRRIHEKEDREKAKQEQNLLKTSA